MKKQLHLLTLSFALLLTYSSLNAQLWPGDINNNGEVNGVDLLHLGYAYGALGPVRPNASTNWLAQAAAPNWGMSFPNNQIDISFADCSGDGVIDDLDILVIEQNFHLTHTVVPDPIILGLPGIDPSIEVRRTSTDTLTPGALEVFEIHFGPTHISNFYGVSFTISYDTAYVDSVVKVLPATGWITNFGQDKVIQVSNSYITPNPANGKNGRIDISYSRTNGQTIFGTGIAGLFAIIMEDNVNGKMPGTIDIEFEVLDIRMTDAALNLWPTVPSLSVFPLADSLVLTTTHFPVDEKETAVLIYPNPALDHCTVLLENATISQLEIIDLNGSVISRKEIANSTSVEFELNNLSNAIYILKITTSKGIVFRKLHIVN